MKRRLQVWEIVLGGAVCVAVGLALWPVRTGDYPRSTTTMCLSNLKQTSLALIMYAGDSNDRLPRVAWMDAIVPYTKDQTHFHCPKAAYSAYGYTMSGKRMGQKLKDDAAADMRPLLFDSSMFGRNAVGDFTSLPVPERHEGGNNFAYEDGRVSRFAPKFSD